MYNIPDETPVIQFTSMPRLVLARYDGGQPDQEIVQLFGAGAKVLALKDVWLPDDCWVEETRTVLGETNWVIISLGLVADDDEIDPVSNETLEEFRVLVEKLRQDKVELYDILDGIPNVAAPRIKLELAALKEEIRRFAERLERGG